MQNYLDTCEILKTKGIKSGFVASRSSAITPSLKVSPSEVSNQMNLFRSGNINALIATSIIEEVRKYTKVYVRKIQSNLFTFGFVFFFFFHVYRELTYLQQMLLFSMMLLITQYSLPRDLEEQDKRNHLCLSWMKESIDPFLNSKR